MSPTADLKDGKEILLQEIEGLKRSLARRERTSEEAVARARTAEAALLELQKTHQTATAQLKGQVKELERGKAQSDEMRAKAESEYAALAKGMK